MNRLLKNVYWSPDEGSGGGAESSPGGEGGEPEIAYLSQISPETREKYKERLAKYPKITNLVEAVVSQEDRLSRAVIVPNMENPDAEELKAFKAAMGLPEKAEEHDIKIEGMEGAEEISELLKKAAFNMGLTKNQGKKFGEVVLKLATAGKAKQGEDRKQAAEQFEPKVLELVGGDEAKKTEVLNLFKRFLIKRIGDTDLVKILADSGLVHNPAFAVKAADIERYFSEESFVEGRPQAGGGPKPKGQFGSYSPEFKAEAGG